MYTIKRSHSNDQHKPSRKLLMYMPFRNSNTTCMYLQLPLEQFSFQLGVRFTRFFTIFYNFYKLPPPLQTEHLPQIVTMTIVMVPHDDGFLFFN